jgi:hypothetical protein
MGLAVHRSWSDHAPTGTCAAAVNLTKHARCSLLQVPGSRTTPINGTATTRQGESAVLNAFTGTDRGLFRSVLGP